MTTGTTRPFSPSAVPTPMSIVGEIAIRSCFPAAVDRRRGRHRFGRRLDDVGGVAELDAALAASAALCAATAEKSASNSAVTCGASATARTIFSAIFSRIRSCGMSLRRELARLRGRRLADADHGRLGDRAVDVLARDAPVAAGALRSAPGRSRAAGSARRTEGERRVSPRRSPAQAGAQERLSALSVETDRRLRTPGPRPRRRIRLSRSVPAAPPAPPRRPYRARSRASTPAAGAGTSCVTLSVSSSTSGSFSAT